MEHTPTRLRLTIDEFTRLYEREGPFEIINGERHDMSPTVMGHNAIAGDLLLALNNYALEKGQGRAYMEAPFVLPESDDGEWVKGSRVPDVMFVTEARLSAYQAAHPDWRDKPLLMVPDLVIEIVSKTDRFSDVDRKVSRYLDDGVQQVWVIEPKYERLIVYAADGTITRYEADAAIDGGDLIPGFSLPLADLFS